VSRQEFEQHLEKGDFLEHVEFLGNLYGTPVPSAPPGRDVLLEIELKGAQQVRRLEPKSIVVLIVPPSIEVQRERLRMRGDDEARIDERVNIGQHEMIAGEKIADETVINDDLETAVRALEDIVKRHRALHS
jgi:guanylate kinase